jgi:hypothetical protein
LTFFMSSSSEPNGPALYGGVTSHLIRRYLLVVDISGNFYFLNAVRASNCVRH